jgi:hypothetical protein
MTAVSFQMSRGVDGFKMSDVTVGSNPPAGGDFEFRWNVLDSSAGTKNINDGDLYRFLKAMELWILTNGALVLGNQVTGITQQPSGPPN